MSRFYGTISTSARRQSTRCGHTHLTTHAAGWRGAIEVTVEDDPETGRDIYTVTLIPWHHTRGAPSRTLSRGFLDAALSE